MGSTCWPLSFIRISTAASSTYGIAFSYGVTIYAQSGGHRSGRVTACSSGLRRSPYLRLEDGGSGEETDRNRSEWSCLGRKSLGETFAALPLTNGGAFTLPIYQYNSGLGMFEVEVIDQQTENTPEGVVPKIAPKTDSGNYWNGTRCWFTVRLEMKEDMVDNAGKR